MPRNKNSRAKQQITLLGSIGLSNKLDLVYGDLYARVGSNDLSTLWNWFNYSDFVVVHVKQAVNQSIRKISDYETD